MRLLLLIFISIFFYTSQAQNSHLNDFCGDFKAYTFVYGGVRILFEPLNTSSNVSDSVLCDTYEEEFYLNGLRIDKRLFINLQLLPRHLSNDSTTFFNRRSSKSGHGIYEYNYDRDNDCANKIIFRVDTKLPIFLNGIQLDSSEQKDKLSKVKPDNIITVIRKTGFYKRGRIEIQTK